METVKKTFREIYEVELNLPRSTVQGWVDKFLPGHGDKDYSKWTFNEKEVDMLWRIRFWKQLGYKNKTIERLLAKGACCEKKTLLNTIQELERQRAELDNVIRVANLMKDTGMTPNGLRFDVIYPIDLPYDMLMEYLGNALEESYYIEDDKWGELLSENVFEEISNCVDIIFELHDVKVSYKSDRVQELVKTIHYKVEPIVSKSVLIFYLGVKVAFKDKELVADIKEEHGSEKYKYLKQCFYWYCDKNKVNDYDVKGLDSLDRIQDLALKRYCTNSPEVQSEVDNLYKWYEGIKFIKEEGRYEVIRRLSQSFAGEKCYKEIDGGKPRGLAWFMSRALAIYCDNAEIV